MDGRRSVDAWTVFGAIPLGLELKHPSINDIGSKRKVKKIRDFVLMHLEIESSIRTIVLNERTVVPSYL